ncbi:MAG: ankyrin repeat domain-containing protein [Saprospiraceae bacterium]|nr:ankyrin repeat domain-containing protein [Saprospiraceae bacterium]MBK7812030.1 ankyrin repeat domain-containing protein [Saprospiraceae bacterium]
MNPINAKVITRAFALNLFLPLFLILIFVSSAFAQSNLLSEAIQRGNFTKSFELLKEKRWIQIKSGQLAWNPLFYSIFQVGIDSLTFEKLKKKNFKECCKTWSEHKKTFLDITKQIIDQGADLQLFDKRGRSAIYYAAVLRLDEVVELLLEKGAKVEDSEDLFQIAASHGYSKIVSQLLKFKLNACETGRNCFSPFHNAAINGSLGVISEMINAKSNLECPSGNMCVYFSKLTPLQLAVMNGRDKVVLKLIQNGANTNVLSSTNENLLHLAVKGPRHEISLLNSKGKPDEYLLLFGGNLGTVLLLDSLYKDLYTVDNEGRTPMHWSAYYYKTEVLKYFLARNKPPIENHTNAAHSMASAISLTFYRYYKNESGSDFKKDELIKIWGIAEKSWNDSLSKINIKLAGRRLLQIGFIAVATAAASYQASIDAASTGYGYSSVEYPILQLDDLTSIRRTINLQLDICQKMKNFISNDDQVNEKWNKLNQLEKILNHE